MVPAPFRSRRALRVLNVAAVGLALAAITSAVLAHVLGDLGGPTAVATGLSTWLFGTLWAALMRWRRTVGRTSFRLGWALSVPLAMVDAALACGLLFGFGPESYLRGSFFGGAFLGATLGAIVWVPALVGTLICFGAPIAWAQRLAKKGLAGEERGEVIVGLACVAMSVLGLVVSADGGAFGRPAVGPAPEWLGIAGLLAGSAATVLAGARERRRRRFVADAEAGKIAGYRVDPTDEGKVLVRVVTQGRGYRVADFEEEVFELDEQGEARRPLQASSPREAPGRTEQ